MANHVSHAALPFPIKNARFTIEVPYLDADGDPTDPTTPDTEFSVDNGAFADCAEEVTTIAGTNGMGFITLTGAETNGSMVGLAAKVASGPKNTLGTIYPRVLAPIVSGVSLSAGSSSGGTLTTALGYDITGCFVRTTGGTGGGGTGGANNQARKITSYNTSTGVFGVIPNFETALDATTTVDVLLPEGMTLGALRALNPTVAGRTADVAATGEVGLDFDNIHDASGAHTLTNITVPVTTAVTNRVTANADQIEGVDATDQIRDAILSDATRFAGASIAAIKAKTDNLPASPAATGDIMKVSTGTGANQLSVSAGVVAASLSAGERQAIWEFSEALITAASTIGLRLKTNITGDIFARLGAPAGASTAADIAAVKTDTAAIKTKTDNLPADPADESNTQAKLDTIIGYIDTEIGTLLSELTAARAEPGAVPAANATLGQKVDWLFMLSRNKRITTTTSDTVRNDGDGADVAAAPLSDNGTTTLTRGKYS